MSVSGSSSTLNNTNTSGATTLSAAPDAAAREAKAASQENPDSIKGPGGLKYDEGAGGQAGHFSGTVTSQGYSGGPTSAQSLSGSSADAAPSYVSSVISDPAQSGKPHGKNITEGGFDNDPSKNASFNSDIGDKNDPGRLSENHFQRRTMESGNDAATSGPRQKGLTGDGQYDVLETDQEL